MSKYTTQVRFICETSAGLLESVGYGDVDRVIESARSKVFDFDYPIFDEKYKGVLETKILKHYYTREIGAETVGLWKLWLNTRMNEIMPYYNKLYESELLEFNPLYDVDITRERKGTTTGVKEETVESTNSGNVTRTGTATGQLTTKDSNKHYDYYSDTPQGGVGNLEDLTYLTNARKTTDEDDNLHSSQQTESGETTSLNDGTSSTDSTITNTEDYLETVKGKQGGSNYAKMLQEYRATFLNIDMKIINDLSDLFINLW